MLIDLSYFFRTKWLMATLVALNLSDMLVVALVYNRMMSIDYFAFFVPGVVIFGMFTAALDVGRRVYLGLTEGVTQYYLSLPVSLNGLVWAHIISGGLGGTFYSLMLLAIALLVLPQGASLNVLFLIPFMFILSMGLAGIAAVLNLFSKKGERYWVFAEGIQVTLLGLSTVFYPLELARSYLPGFLHSFIEFNPISQGADALRTLVFKAQPLMQANIAQMLLSSLILLVVGTISFRQVFSKVRDIGKV